MTMTEEVESTLGRELVCMEEREERLGGQRPQPLQRETREGSKWLTLPAYVVLASLMGSLLASFAWTLHRVHSGGGRARRSRAVRRTAAAPA